MEQTASEQEEDKEEEDDDHNPRIKGGPGASENTFFQKLNPV